jgi:hypothetical protein
MRRTPALPARHAKGAGGATARALAPFVASLVAASPALGGCGLLWSLDDYDSEATSNSQNVRADAGADSVGEADVLEGGGGRDHDSAEGGADSPIDTLTDRDNGEGPVQDSPNDAPPPTLTIEKEPTSANGAECDPSQPDLAQWSNPNAVCDDGGASASVSAPANSCKTTCLLGAYGFDFGSVPDDAVVTGIRLRAWAKWSGTLTNFCKSTFIAWGLHGIGGAATLQDAPISLDSGEHAQWITHGGSGDLWGAGAVSGAQIKASSFGVFTYTYLIPPASRIDVDSIYVQIWYHVSN